MEKGLLSCPALLCAADFGASLASPKGRGQVPPEIEVVLSRLFGHEQHKNDIHFAAVGGAVVNGLLQADQTPCRLAQVIDATMRDRNALTNGGTTQFFTRE